MNRQIFLFIPFLLLLFSPSLSYFVSLIFLIIAANLNLPKKKEYFIFLAIVTTMSLLFNITSYKLFLYQDDDFTAYYNNYISFLNNGFSFEYFEFGFGIEIGVPLLNYIFSILIRENVPYIIYFLHASLQLMLLTFAIRLISKYHELDLKNTILLFVFTIVLFKYGLSMNQIRQAYASLFIIIAIFSKRHKYLYFLIGIFFHITTIFIYPLISFLLMTTSVKKLKIFSIISIIFGIVLVMILETNLDAIFSIENVFANKIKLFIFMARKAPSFLSMIPLNPVVYILFLIVFYRFVLVYYKISSKSYWNLYAILVFTVSLSVLGGVSARLLAPIFTYLIGYLFFKYLCIEIKIKQAYLFALFFIIIFQIKFTFYNNLYFRNYPIASIVPLYYIPKFFEAYDYVDRSNMPAKKSDLKIKNRMEEMK